MALDSLKMNWQENRYAYKWIKTREPYTHKQ